MTQAKIKYVPWKRYTFAVSQAIFIFTLASFMLGYYFIHARSVIAVSVALCLLYAAFVGYSIYRMVKEFSIVAIMLMIPIAPLIILMIVISLIHLLQFV
jgi:hypothetical protein